MEIQVLPRQATARNERASNNRNPLSGLTARQQEIVLLLLEGYSNKIIARKLGISPNTVKVHIQAIFRELRVHNRMALAVALRPFFAACAYDKIPTDLVIMDDSNRNPLFNNSSSN
jgi:DNA-binding NarL/FixJ family response regulator